MNDRQTKIIAESLALMSKVSTVNALDYIKHGLEAYKTVEIPILDKDGKVYAIKEPYKQEVIREFVDFMIVYFDEAIKSLEGYKKNG